MKKTWMKWLMGLGLASLLWGVVLAFQNCAGTADGSLFDNSTASALGEKLPFAYDVTIDELSYNSCSEMDGSYDPNTFFTFKAGAYNFAGVTLRTDARNSLAILPTGTFPSDVLGASPINNGVSPQFDIRLRGQMQFRQSVGGGDYGYLVDPLSQSGIVNALMAASPGQRLRVMADAFGGAPHRVETILHIAGGDGEAAYIRDNLLSSAMLTLVYANNNGAGTQPAASPVGAPGVTIPAGTNYTAQDTLFGRGYTLTFTRPNPSDIGQGGSPSANMGTRVLASMNEVNLDLITHVGDPASTWTCPINLRLMVVRPQDVAATSCQAFADPANPGVDLQRVRNALPNNLWYVDLAHHCVIQKSPASGNCYGSATPKVNYSISTNCAPNDPINGSCAHFVSICYR